MSRPKLAFGFFKAQKRPKLFKVGGLLTFTNESPDGTFMDGIAAV